MQHPCLFTRLVDSSPRDVALTIDPAAVSGCWITWFKLWTDTGG